MKYWLLSTEYPPFFGGGISTYSSITARMFAEAGYEVTVFINDPAVKDHAAEVKDQVRLVRFNPSRSKADAFLGHVTNISFAFSQIVKEFVLKEGKPEVIETQEYLGIGYYLLQCKHLDYDWCRDVPVLVTMHSPSFLYLEYNHVPLFKYPNFWIGEMERFCIQAADLVISPSKYLVEEVNERFKIRKSAVIVLPNPFSNNATVQDHSLEKDPDQIVFFGKLSAQKGTFKLLQYFKALWDKGFTETLYLIGGQDIVYHPESKTMGDLVRKQYKAFIEKGLLILEDKIAPSQINQRLKKAKVVIVPSTVDNLPYVVMEMMRMGQIVLVSKQGGQAEIVNDGINGFVFDHQSPDTFFEKLDLILNLSQENRLRISQNAIIRIKSDFGPSVIFEKKKAIIHDLIHQNNARKEFPFLQPIGNAKSLNIADSGKPGLLSIVVPYFNMGNYIAETIASIQAADYPEKEIIIINDGSTDAASIAKLDAYRNAPEIRVIDCENGGLARARNHGAALANGVFLAFLDADDCVEPDYYSKAIKVLGKYDNVHFVGAWTRYFEDSSRIWPTFNPEPPLILYHNTVNSSGLVYKRNSFLEGGINDADMPFMGLEDYDSVISMLHNGFQGVVLPEPLFRYRVRKNSMIRGVSKSKKLILQDYISTKHKLFYAKFASENFNLLNANGPGIALDNPTLDFNLTDKLPFNAQLSRQVIALIKRNNLARYVAYRTYKLLNN